MSSLNRLYQRRSYRSFDTKEVSKQDLKDIVKAGLCAPTALSAKNYNVYVVTDESCKKVISGIHEWADFAHKGAAILVVARNNEPRLGEYDYIDEEYKEINAQNILAHMQIACELKGMVSCQIGMKGDETKLSTTLGLSESDIAMNALVIGWPDLNYTPENTRKEKRSFTIIKGKLIEEVDM